MHVEDRKPPQYIYLYEKNVEFVQRERNEPVHIQNIYRNINKQTNLPRLILEQDVVRFSTVAYCLGWISIIAATVFIAYLLAVLSVIALHEHEFGREIGMLALYLVIVCFALIWGIGYPVLTGRTELELEKSPCTEKLYKVLIGEGIIISGTLTHVQKITRQDVELHYSFQSPDKKVQYGIYLTRANSHYKQGRNVAILYLNPDLHILL